MQTRRTGGLLAVSGVAGVVVGHWAAYVLAVPGGVERAQYLSATGHGYWPMAVGVALIGGFVAIVASGLRGRALACGTASSTDGQFSAAGLAAWQLALFTLMEAGERLGSGGSMATLVRDPAFLVGLGVQIVVAVLVVSLLRAIERGVELLVGALRRPPLVAGLRPGWVERSWVVSSGIGGKPGARGPPRSGFC